MTAPIVATIIDSYRANAEGISASGSAPVLALCRKLIEAGHDAARPLHAYRGDVLALKVRSIGEGARLEIAGNGVGLRWPPAMGRASPVRQTPTDATALAA